MKISGGKKSTMKHSNIFVFIVEYVQWKYIFSNITTVCVSYVKPVKQITFLCHSITITSAVITKDRLEVISLSNLS